MKRQKMMSLCSYGRPMSLLSKKEKERRKKIKMINFFKKRKLSPEKRLELAKALFNNLNLGTGDDDDENNSNKEALKIIKQAKDRQEVLDKIIELCQDIENPVAYYLIGTAYTWKGAKYRTQAIPYLEKYVANPVEIEKAFYEREGEFIDGFSSGIVLSYVYSNLARCYEGEYIFDKALEYYQKALELDPSVASKYIHLANIYVKMNNLDKAIEVMQNAKNSKYYKTIKKVSPVDGTTICDNSFIYVIDNYLQGLYEKKQKGYVYKPRKRTKQSITLNY
ncbi:tetratricopeptide repeat protein [Thermoanaerobacteraceae bacterium SP2]|nr:tetratricopeptide repeat protein [Thermoanaerobacteraceae bacterium SP2]